jgi:hypothetical protein
MPIYFFRGGFLNMFLTLGSFIFGGLLKASLLKQREEA